MDNFVVCFGNLTEEAKFKYMKENICSKFDKVLYYCYGSTGDILHEYRDKGYFAENVFAPPEDSSMIMEPFTLGSPYQWHKWISRYNQDFDVLIIDRTEQKKYLPSDRVFAWWRDISWIIKPIYFFTEKAADDVKKICKCAEIIDLMMRQLPTDAGDGE